MLIRLLYLCTQRNCVFVINATGYKIFLYLFTFLLQYMSNFVDFLLYDPRVGSERFRLAEWYVHEVMTDQFI